MITLHHVPFSRSFRVLWLLEELELDYQIKSYSIRDGTMRSDNFLDISPAGRVPALEIDGTTLVESSAIVQYLCNRYPDKRLSPDQDHEDWPRFLEMLSFAETMASLIENLNLQHVFLRDPSDASPVVLKLLTARLRATLVALEKVLGDQDYLLRSGFSGADTMLGFNLLAAPYYVDLSPLAKLQAYWHRIKMRPAFAMAREKDGKQDFYTKDFYPVPGS